MMNAIAVAGGAGSATALQLVQVPKPVPRDGEVLLRVLAAGVNRPDLLQREGRYPPPPGAPETLGLEVCAEVVADAGRWRAGERVCALLGGGGYAEFVAVDARHALPLPPGLDRVHAAALPETVFTAYANLFEHGRLRAGETVLVHGATSGIGVAAMQMARAAGARVIATSRGAAKAAAARSLGADIAIDVGSEDFSAVAREAGGVDVALDMVGAPYLVPTLRALRHGGRIVYIAGQGGGTLEVPLAMLMQKQAVLTGSLLRVRSADEKARLAAEVERVVWPWVAAGQLRAVVDRTFPLARAAEAHAWLEEGRHIGKVVLTVAD